MQMPLTPQKKEQKTNCNLRESSGELLCVIGTLQTYNPYKGKR